MRVLALPSGCLPERPSPKFLPPHRHAGAIGADIHDGDGAAAGFGLPLLPSLRPCSHPLDHALDLPGTGVNATGLGQMLLRLLITGFIGSLQAHQPGQGRRVTRFQAQRGIGGVMTLPLAFMVVIVSLQRERTEHALDLGADPSLVVLAWLGLIGMRRFGLPPSCSIHPTNTLADLKTAVRTKTSNCWTAIPFGSSA